MTHRSDSPDSSSSDATQAIGPTTRATFPRTQVHPEFAVESRRERRWFQVLLAVAFLLGVAAGVATSYLQDPLPQPSDTVANSGAVWSLIAFLIALLSRQRGVRAAVIGALALLGEVAGYYAIAAPFRDLPSTADERLLWAATALLVGPIVGFAAGWWTGGRLRGRLAASAVMSGIVLGEGVHGLVRLEFDALQWWIEVVLGAAVGSIAATYYGTSTFWRLLGILATLGVAALVYVVYGNPFDESIWGIG